MSKRHWSLVPGFLLGFAILPAFFSTSNAPAQPDFKKEFKKGDGGGFDFKGGPPGGAERKIVKIFDKDGNGWLNKDERAVAREEAKKAVRPGRGFGPGFGRGESGKPGPKVALTDVKSYPPETKLYDPTALRTLFFEFENADWEAELADFHNTDVEVPATLVVDGKKYPNVGLHFRGMSSFMGIGAGSKRSLNVALDLVDPKQRLNGYKTLNLLNLHEDSSFMSTVLYSHIASKYIPTPKANFVKVVINGESWGIYTNVQQFNKEFVNEHYKTTKGARWKVSGSPGGGGGLDYIGDNVEDYKRRYEIKSSDNEKAWKDLINLCKVLSQTPTDKLEEALRPILDIDSVLWFLALDNALINSDGYWIRASDFSIYQDEKGMFHIIPHDMNEAFRPAMGPGMGGPGGGGIFGPGGGGGGRVRMPAPGEIMPPPAQDMLQLNDEQRKQIADMQKDIDAKLEKILTDAQKSQIKAMREAGPFGPPGGMQPGGQGGSPVSLDPLVGLDDAKKPLRSKLLKVPSLKAKYLANVRTIASESLDWKNLGPVVAQFRTLIEKEVELDTRKLTSLTDFKSATSDAAVGNEPGAGRRGQMSLRAFADARRAYLLKSTETK